jgi:hypothetical protein
MWLTVAVAYCLVCSLGTGLLFYCHAAQLREERAEDDPPFAVVAVVSVLLVPLIFPYVVWATWRACRQERRRRQEIQIACRQFREYEFVPVDSQAVAAHVRRWFEKHTPALAQLGYELLGDYRLKPAPLDVCTRLFLSPDGDTLASVCTVLKSGGVELLSVLADGTCVDTASVDNPHPERTLEPADRLCVTYLPGASVQDLHRRHATTVRELSARHGTSVLRFWSDQFREVAVYFQRLFCRWQFRHGHLDAEPPAADFRTLRGVPRALSPAPAQVAQEHGIWDLQGKSVRGQDA